MLARLCICKIEFLVFFSQKSYRYLVLPMVGNEE